MLGRLEIQRDQQTLAGLESAKAQELFCYLLLNRSRAHTRDALADLLWGEHAGAQAKKYLRKTLWQLLGALDERDKPADRPVLVAEPEWLRLNPSAEIWLDVADFGQAAALVQGVPGESLDPARARVLREALDLYQGDLLEGWYQPWCQDERERLQSIQTSMLDKLMGFAEARREYDAGLEYGALILRREPARERTHQRLMRLHYLAGDRASALRQYERCVATLGTDLDVSPSKRTEVLYQEIRADRLEPPGQPGAERLAELPRPSERSSVERSPDDPLSRLRQLRASLLGVLHQVDHDIEALELAGEARQ